MLAGTLDAICPSPFLLQAQYCGGTPEGQYNQNKQNAALLLSFVQQSQASIHLSEGRRIQWKQSSAIWQWGILQKHSACIDKPAIC